MLNGRIQRAVAVSLLAGTLVVASLVTPGVAHDSDRIGHNWTRHYKRLAMRSFFTKRQSNLRFVNVGERASDSALLDGLDSSAFASSSHAHSGADITSGTVAEARIDALIARVADVFDLVLAEDGSGSGLDADLLDGLTAADFALAGQTESAQWFKEAADSIGTATTTERVIFTAPEAVTITGITIEPAAALTANDSNFATITVSRRDATGANPVTVVSETTQTVVGGGTGNWTAFSTVSLGSLSNASLAAGQKLTIAVAKSGLSGVVLPVLSMQVRFTVG